MKVYPEQVSEMVSKVVPHFQEFLTNENVPQDILEQFLTEKFINGEPLQMSDEEVEELMKLSLVENIIGSLKERGFIDSIEDENGEEWYWATKEGLQAAEQEKQSQQETN